MQSISLQSLSVDNGDTYTTIVDDIDLPNVSLMGEHDVVEVESEFKVRNVANILVFVFERKTNGIRLPWDSKRCIGPKVRYKRWYLGMLRQPSGHYKRKSVMKDRGFETL